MSRNITLLILFFVTLTINARSAKKVSEAKTFSPEWKTNNSVRKLYDTPLGEVFEFTPTNPFLSPAGYNQRPTENQLNSIQFELYKNSRERKEMKRFIVIDFKMRVFPAISESENPRLYFVLTRSTNGASSIEKLKNINGQAAYMDYSWLFHPRTLKFTTTYKPKKARRGKKAIKKTFNMKQEAYASLGYSFRAAYDIVSIRMIIDTSLDGIITSNVNNGLHWVLRKNYSKEKVYPVRSFGILVTDIEVKRPKLGKNRRLLELSRPKVIFTNNEAYIQDLPPIKFEKYPYDVYMTITEKSKKRKKKKRNIKRLDNPDEIYGNALNLLKGQDLIEGVKLLTYIAKRKEHILAMNQLGICYWRGIGVKPDHEKALRWFKKAGNYYLPDALAYGGASSLKEASKPYISDHIKNSIFHALNKKKLPKNIGKHSTSIFLAILNHAGISSEQSAKLDYWIVRNRTKNYVYNRHTYYTDPKYYYNISNGISHKAVATKANIDELNMHLKEQIRQLDKCIKENFSPAIYYKGQLLIARSKKEERESALKEAMAIFKRGAKLGNIECAIEVMHCKARLGLLKLEDFDTETYVKFSDYPLYYLLKYIVKNPNAPGVKEFLIRDYRGARRIWRKKSDGMSNFLLALEGIYQFFHYGMDNVYYRLYNDDFDDLKTAYSHLDAAVKANIKYATYLKGVYYLNKKYNHFAGMRSADIQSGIYLLNKIAPQNIKAQYYIIKNDFYNNKRRNQKQLEQLKPLLELKYPDAWLLYSDILASLTQGHFKKKKLVIDAYKKAAELGSVRAWDRLARMYYTQANQSYRSTKTQNENRAAMIKYWKKFVKEDNKQRRNDPCDPYWPDLKPSKTINPHVAIYGKKEDPKGYKILYKYLKKYYIVKNKKNTDDRFQILKGGPQDIGELDKDMQGKSKKQKYQFKKPIIYIHWP